MKSISIYSLFLYTFILVAVFLISFNVMQAHSSEGEYVVRMTDDGFDPKEIEINAGDTVVFENDSAVTKWPATNIHPTHTVYPDSNVGKCGTDEAVTMFDACAGVVSGESYEFVFSKVGIWKYHDHLFPRMGGEIRVVGDEKPASFISRIGTWIQGAFDVLTGPFRRAYVRWTTSIDTIEVLGNTDDDVTLRNLVSTYGSSPVMKRLLDEAGGGSEFDCHQEAHAVGRIAYEIFGADVFAEGDASCHSGFYHGAMESLLSEEGTLRFVETINGICDSFSTSFGIFQCLHGVGHGVLAYEDYDLPSALATCDQLDSDWSASSCSGGVFMENIITAQGYGAAEDHETDWVSRENLHFPCDAIGESARRQIDCYQMQTSWMLTVLDYNFEAVSLECANAPESSRRACYLSLGRDAAGYTLRDPEGILEICNFVPKEDRYYSDCIYGAVNVIVDFWGPALETQADDFCSEISNTDARSFCRDTVQLRLSDVKGE